MKNIVVLMLLFTGFVNGQIVNIPDPIFKNFLVTHNPTIDSNGNNEIEVDEAAAYTNLFLMGDMEINDLTGIEAFVNLTGLYCLNNNLTSLDVSNLTQLNTLYCQSNQLTLLILPVSSTLTSLECQFNQLTTLDVSSLPNLYSFFCNDNVLTTINTTGLTNLYEVYCYSNQLSTLDVSSSTNLFLLSVSNNPIVTIDLSNNQNLHYFSCSDSLLSTIDVSSCSELITFVFLNNPNLTSVYMKNGASEDINLSNNPNLEFICADEEEVTSVQQLAALAGLNSTVVNSYCTFIPGGDYNTITGAIIFDANNNGCDASDVPHPNIKININDGTIQGATFTNNSGNYNFYTQGGSFDVSLDVENSSWFNFSPTSATIPFANTNNNVATQNFCITANGVHPDIEIVLAPIIPARPGFDAVYQIVYKNKGNQTISGNVTFSYVEDVLNFVTATALPVAQSVGQLNWNYQNLLPFENRSIYLTLHVNSPQETPAINSGDVLPFDVSITSSTGDEIPEDNVFVFNQTVIGSYDPNDITCIEGNVVPPSEIGEYLHYVINFENIGTAEAENIVVRTDIDATQFDVNSLQMLDTSHNAYIRQTGNTIEFIFEGIYLDTGGHGNVLLKIRSINNLQEGDTVAKQANIFFDYNFPIETNMANTTFQALNTPGFEIDESISVYPNPTNSIVTIKCNNSMQSVQLYDVQGRLLQTQIINNQTTTVDLSQQSNGIYFVKIASENGGKVEKIVKN